MAVFHIVNNMVSSSPAPDVRTSEVALLADTDEYQAPCSLNPVSSQPPRRSPQSHVKRTRSRRNPFCDQLVGQLTQPSEGATLLAAQRFTGGPFQSSSRPLLGGRTEPTMEPSAGSHQPHAPKDRERTSPWSDNSSTLDRSSLVRAVAASLRFIPSHTTRERSTIRIRVRQPRLGPANL